MCIFLCLPRGEIRLACSGKYSPVFPLFLTPPASPWMFYNGIRHGSDCCQSQRSACQVCVPTLVLVARVKFFAIPNRIVRFLLYNKGTVSRDFMLLVFFMNQFPPSPRVSHEDRFKFFRKFCGATQGAPPVSTTPMANLPPV
jgi:hypothetical protein